MRLSAAVRNHLETFYDREFAVGLDDELPNDLPAELKQIFLLTSGEEATFPNSKVKVLGLGDFMALLEVDYLYEELEGISIFAQDETSYVFVDHEGQIGEKGHIYCSRRNYMEPDDSHKLAESVADFLDLVYEGEIETLPVNSDEEPEDEDAEG